MIESMRKKITQILELKNMIELKNLIEHFNSSLDQAGEESANSKTEFWNCQRYEIAPSRNKKKKIMKNPH